MHPLLTLTCVMVALAGCTDTESSSDDVNRAGSWQVSFVRLVDVDGPPYVEEQPAPEYPMRTMHAPVPDPASCTPGCDCAFVAATDVCDGDVGETCHAWGGFTETCSLEQTLLDCSMIEFESDASTIGVCVLEDTSMMTEFGYAQIRRYQVTLDRLTYD